MRKVILTLLFSAFGLYAIGQNAFINTQSYKKPLKQTVLPGPMTQPGSASVTAGTPVTGWYDAINDAQNTGAESYTVYNNTIFADSTVKTLYGNGSGGTQLGYVFQQGMGEVFDPKSPVYVSALSLYNTYTVDSLALFYLYNYVPEKDPNTGLATHDTLIFQFYTLKTGGIDTGMFAANGSNPAEPWAYPLYNYTKNLGSGNTGQTVKIVLGQEYNHPDTPTAIQIPVMTSAGAIGIPVNYTINKKEGYNRDLFAFTVSYRPGFKYKLGDTIDEKSTPLPKNLHSHFKVLTGHSAKDALTNYEMSVEVVSSTRYNEPPAISNGWDGKYIPGTAWLGSAANNVPAYNEVLYSAFQITANGDAAVNKSVGDPKGYILGNVYPNPANGTARLDFAVANTEQVKITMYDMLGHELTTLADGQYLPGAHTVSFNTDNLKEGVYLYSINAGSFSKTLKFTVTHN